MDTSNGDPSLNKPMPKQQAQQQPLAEAAPPAQQQPQQPFIANVVLVPPQAPPQAAVHHPSAAFTIPDADELCNQIESNVKKTNKSYFNSGTGTTGTSTTANNNRWINNNDTNILQEYTLLICKEEMPRYQDPYARFAMGIPPWPPGSVAEELSPPPPPTKTLLKSSSTTLTMNNNNNKNSQQQQQQRSAAIAPAMATGTVILLPNSSMETTTTTTDKKKKKKRSSSSKEVAMTTAAAAATGIVDNNKTTKSTIVAAAAASDGNRKVDVEQKRQAALAGHRKRRGSLLTTWSEHLTYDWSELLPTTTPGNADNNTTTMAITTGSAAWNVILRQDLLHNNPQTFPQIPQMSAVDCLAIIQPRLLICTIIPPEHSPIYNQLLVSNKRFKPSPTATAQTDEEDCKPAAKISVVAAAQNVKESDKAVADLEEKPEQELEQEHEMQEMTKLYKTMITQETDTYMDMKRREYQYMNASSVKDRMVHLASETASLAAKETRLRRQAASVFNNDNNKSSNKKMNMNYYQQQANKMAGHWSETDRAVGASPSAAAAANKLDRPYWSERIWDVLSVNPMQVRCLSEADVY